MHNGTVEKKCTNINMHTAAATQKCTGINIHSGAVTQKCTGINIHTGALKPNCAGNFFSKPVHFKTSVPVNLLIYARCIAYAP
jgi:hypothetical protein